MPEGEAKQDNAFRISMDSIDEEEEENGNDEFAILRKAMKGVNVDETKDEVNWKARAGEKKRKANYEKKERVVDL